MAIPDQDDDIYQAINALSREEELIWAVHEATADLPFRPLYMARRLSVRARYI